MSKRKDLERAEAGRLHREGKLVTPEQASKIDRMVKKVSGKVNWLVDHTITRKLQKLNIDGKAKAARNLVKAVGANKMRDSVIEAAELDIADCVKQGMTDDEILQPCLDSKNYMALLSETGLTIENLKVIINQKRRG